MVLPEAGLEGEMTRMRVPYRKIRLTGVTGKIERSAEALQISTICISLIVSIQSPASLSLLVKGCGIYAFYLG